MNINDRLKQIYTEPVLPQKLSDKYRILSCLKHSIKRVYLAEDTSSGGGGGVGT